MKLSKKEVDLFYRLYYSLLFYVNRKFKILKGVNSPEDLGRFPAEELNKIKKTLYEHPELINSFVSENPLNLSASELKIVSSWKDFVKGEFFIFRYLKDYAVFLSLEDQPKAYGVLALNSTFEEVIGQYLPIMVEAILLPFNGRIIYDGVLSSYSITFGSGIRSSLNDAYREAKARFGIITSLPYSPEEKEQSDADKLRFYLSNERNRGMYQEEIEELIDKNPDLLTLYHQEMGKIYSRTYRRRLREIGLTKGWFAMLEGMIIAAGVTRDEVEQILQCILPPEKREFVYIFQLKEK